MGAGHYYAFIRPNLDDKWYEFNDSNVTEVLKSTALTRGYGGFETKFELRDGKVMESKSMTYISAYMLVYVREGDRDIVMNEIGMQEIPPHLKERFDEENQINSKLERDQDYLNECGNVYIVTQDTILNWNEGGVFQTPDDIYENQRFYENDEQRLMLKMSKKSKIVDLLTLIRKKAKYPPNDLHIFRVKYTKKN